MVGGNVMHKRLPVQMKLRCRLRVLHCHGKEKEGVAWGVGGWVGVLGGGVEIYVDSSQATIIEIN